MATRLWQNHTGPKHRHTQYCAYQRRCSTCISLVLDALASHTWQLNTYTLFCLPGRPGFILKSAFPTQRKEPNERLSKYYTQTWSEGKTAKLILSS